ncbi:MAG TPA: hypothetical protein VMJ90_07005, partial [Anaerolineales bacterium]|nr:hypothetical protein [Anaerolineales bacterium]
MLSNLQISKESLYLCSFFFVAQFFNGINDARGSYSEFSNYGFALAFYWALNWWFLTDSRKHGTGWTDGYLDMGMYLYIAGFIVVPYYLFKTRGWKALYTIGLFFG